jgi:predicted transcriptional regulator
MENTHYAGGSMSLSRALENEALEKADAALAMTEQLQSIIRDLESFGTLIPREFRDEINSLVGRTKALYEMVDSSPLDLNTLSERLPSCKIVRMGINREIIELYLKGMALSKIAEQFGVSADMVRRFCRFYDDSSQTEKITIRRWSILDTADRMEEIGALIFSQLANLNGDPENQVKYVDSQLKLIKMAQEFLKSWETKGKIEKTQVIIQEIFQDELRDYPQLKESVLRRFSALGVRGALI